MDRSERLACLIELLVGESPQLSAARASGELAVPAGEQERYRLWRSLVNVRQPRPASEAYLQAEDAFLREEARRKGVVTLDAIRQQEQPAAAGRLLLWQGDITRLATDGIVNAANAQLLGCFQPCHGCIDNAIHTQAGVRLRLACAELMRAQDGPEPVGRAKLTAGFNLPAAHVLHTVGPIVAGSRPTKREGEQLASCYEACLDAAAEHGLGSIAFCCISTGEFRFPKPQAARIATGTVRAWQQRAAAAGRPVPTVVFNVFSDEDLALYQRLLEE